MKCNGLHDMDTNINLMDQLEEEFGLKKIKNWDKKKPISTIETVKNAIADSYAESTSSENKPLSLFHVCICTQ